MLGQSNKKSKTESVAGKIRNHQTFWEKELDASPYVLDIIKNGYKLPLKTIPPQFSAQNNKSSLYHKDFATTTINQLLRDGCIKEGHEMPYCVNPLTVAENKGKLRFVLDLRHVNQHLHMPKFKYEDLKNSSRYFRKRFYVWYIRFKTWIPSRTDL